jgi:integrase
MPRKRENDRVCCKYFQWIIHQRKGVWTADGRSNSLDAGRHSLGTRDREEALKLLHELDLSVAVNFKLAPPSAALPVKAQVLSLEEGRALYDNHTKRPRAIGGLSRATQKRYRTVHDKFIPFAKARGVVAWNHVCSSTLEAYASHLEGKGYAPKTLRNELTTLVQTHKWLIREKHLIGVEPLRLTVRKQESERPYCYTVKEVEAMVAYCRERPKLRWVEAVIVALACTGLRIAELASLRWSDVDLKIPLIKLSDESGQPGREGKVKRELKSGRSRTIPIHHDLAAVLSTLDRRDAFVFHGPRGGRLKPDTVRQVLIREVIGPLSPKFPALPGEKGFRDGRLHSFRHFFTSQCALDPDISEFTTMQWLGHADSAMVRHYFHLNNTESQRRMRGLNLLGAAGKQLPGNGNGAANTNQETPPSPERTGEEPLVTA